MKLDIDKIMDIILKKAEFVRDCAEQNGERHDGGSKYLENQVRFYKMGYNQTFPFEWKEYEEQYNRENDPEYAQFLKLKEKFE